MIERRILAEVLQAAEALDDWRSLGLTGSEAGCGIHVAVMLEPFLGHILAGRKSIESRFSKYKITPYGAVDEGDFVLLKAGPLRASFRASSVRHIELDPGERARLVRDHSRAICADRAFWQARENKSFATLIGVSDVRRLTPIRISKKDRRGWLVVRESAARREPIAPTGPAPAGTEVQE
jgi:hypothetical protein